MTIVEAAAAVLRSAGRPLTAGEIAGAIAKDNLYAFKAQNPAQIVLQQLRRHCVGVENAQSSKTKLFERSLDGRFSSISQP